MSPFKYKYFWVSLVGPFFDILIIRQAKNRHMRGSTKMNSSTYVQASIQYIALLKWQILLHILQSSLNFIMKCTLPQQSIHQQMPVLIRCKNYCTMNTSQAKAATDRLILEFCIDQQYWLLRQYFSSAHVHLQLNIINAISKTQIKFVASINSSNTSVQVCLHYLSWVEASEKVQSNLIHTHYFINNTYFFAIWCQRYQNCRNSQKEIGSYILCAQYSS